MVRRVIFKSKDEFIVEYDDLSQELRRLNDKLFKFRESSTSDLVGQEFWNMLDYELDGLIKWSWHVRWLFKYTN